MPASTVQPQSMPDPSWSGAGGPRVLGINPWIYDFAAYNLWSRPAGLLACLDMLRGCGCRVGLLDCLERIRTGVSGQTRVADQSRPGPDASADAFGCGPYPRTILPRPAALAHVPRNYARYGQPLEAVRSVLARLAGSPERPDLVLLTSGMTYHYPGPHTAARLVRETLPDVPVLLGGPYASLCPDHAGDTGLFDAVLSGPLERPDNWAVLWSALGRDVPSAPASAGLSLALDLYPDPEFSIILGSRGCPFACAYCASRLLHPGFVQNRAAAVIAAVDREYARGVRDFAFYDDALLINPDAWLNDFLDICPSRYPDIRLHTPNALHIRCLDPATCRRLRTAGFRTIRLGLESADFSARADVKVTAAHWRDAARNLRTAGFTADEVGAYVLFGLPDQEERDILDAVAAVRAQGFQARLAEFTPIPGTPLFDRAVEVSSLPLAPEPLCHNNSIWPCVPGGFTPAAKARWRGLLGRL